MTDTPADTDPAAEPPGDPVDQAAAVATNESIDEGGENAQPTSSSVDEPAVETFWQVARSMLPDAYVWARSASRRMDQHSARLYAAAIAYRTIFAFIAFLSTFALLAILLGLSPGELRQHAGSDGQIDAIEHLETVGWDKAAQTLEMGSFPAWLAGIIGFGVGLYTLAGGFAALCDVLDRIHGVHQYRGYSRRMGRAAGVSLVFLLFAAIVGFLLLLTTGFGEFVFGNLGLDRLAGLWSFLFRVVIPACAVIIIMGFVLRYGSHARPPWNQVLPGAAVASAAWLLMLGGFASYIVLFKGFQAYGVLGSTIAVLVFGYLQAYIVILVAMFREEIAKVISLIPGIRRGGDGSSVQFDWRDVAETLRGERRP